MEVLLMRQHHVVKLNRECVRRCRERKGQRNTIEHMRKVRKSRQAHRSNNRNNKDLLEGFEPINLAFEI